MSVNQDFYMSILSHNFEDTLKHLNSPYFNFSDFSYNEQLNIFFKLFNVFDEEECSIFIEHEELKPFINFDDCICIFIDKEYYTLATYLIEEKFHTCTNFTTLSLSLKNHFNEQVWESLISKEKFVDNFNFAEFILGFARNFPDKINYISQYDKLFQNIEEEDLKMVITWSSSLDEYNIFKLFIKNNLNHIIAIEKTCGAIPNFKEFFLKYKTENNIENF